MKSLRLSFTLAVCLAISSCDTTETANDFDELVPLEADGVSGSTALGSYDVEMKTSPLSRLKAYLDSNGFRVDTAHFHNLDEVLYPDLQNKAFTARKTAAFIYLDKTDHRMGHTNLLVYGYGYYYRLHQSSASSLTPEFILEYWKMDTTRLMDLPTVLSDWEALYPSLCFQTVVNGDNLYVLYTNNVQYGRYLRSFSNVLKSQ